MVGVVEKLEDILTRFGRKISDGGREIAGQVAQPHTTPSRITHADTSFFSPIFYPLLRAFLPRAQSRHRFRPPYSRSC